MEGCRELSKLAKSDTCSVYLFMYPGRFIPRLTMEIFLKTGWVTHQAHQRGVASLRVGFRPLGETNQFRGHARVRARCP